MTNQDDLIGINLICILLIIISLVSAIGYTTRVIMQDFIKTYNIVNFGSGIANLSMRENPIFIFFHIIFAISALLALKKREVGRKLTLIMATLGIVIFYIIYFIAYIMGNDTTKYSLLIQSGTLTHYILLYITTIYVFTRSKVKERFR